MRKSTMEIFKRSEKRVSFVSNKKYIAVEQDDNLLNSNSCDCFQHVTESRAHKAPPDGGYGWIVLMAGFLGYYCIGAIWTSFSVFYTEFIVHFQSGTATIGFIIAAETAAVHITGAFLSWPIQRFGTDKITCILSIISTIGCLTAAFSKSIPMLIATYICVGCGVGFIAMPIVVSVNQYFETRRVFANGVILSGVSLSTFTQPLFARWLIDVLSWRGALIITAGFYLQLLWIGLLLKPLNPYSKTKQPLNICICNEGYHKRESICDNKRKVPSENWFGQVLLKIFDFRLFFDIRFVLIGCGTIAVGIGYRGYFLHLSNRAVVQGMDKYQAAVLVSLLGLTNGICRLSMVTKFNNLLILTLGLLLAGAMCIISIFAEHFLHFAVISCLFGLFTASVLVVQNPVLVDILGAAALPKTTGVMQIFNFVASLVATPLSGFIFDQTGSYTYSYIAVGAIEMFGGILVFICYLITLRRTHKEKDL